MFLLRILRVMSKAINRLVFCCKQARKIQECLIVRNHILFIPSLLTKWYQSSENIELIHVTSEDQVADIFTKPLPTMKFEKFKKLLGMKDEKKNKFKRG
jgi:hypothetical protein